MLQILTCITGSDTKWAPWRPLVPVFQGSVHYMHIPHTAALSDPCHYALCILSYKLTCHKTENMQFSADNSVFTEVEKGNKFQLLQCGLNLWSQSPPWLKDLFFFFQKNYCTTHITEEWVTQEGKKRCRGWSSISPGRRSRQSGLGQFREVLLCHLAAVCVTLRSAVSRIHSVFHDHTQQLSIKSHIAYLLNSRFALKHSQAEPEYSWKAWINFLQLQVSSDDSLLYNRLLHTLSYSVKCILMQYANMKLKAKDFRCGYLKCTSPQQMIMVH